MSKLEQRNIEQLEQKEHELRKELQIRDDEISRLTTLLDKKEQDYVTREDRMIQQLEQMEKDLTEQRRKITKHGNFVSRK